MFYASDTEEYSCVCKEYPHIVWVSPFPEDAYAGIMQAINEVEQHKEDSIDSAWAYDNTCIINGMFRTEEEENIYEVDFVFHRPTLTIV